MDWICTTCSAPSTLYSSICRKSMQRQQKPHDGITAACLRGRMTRRYIAGICSQADFADAAMRFSPCCRNFVINAVHYIQSNKDNDIESHRQRYFKAEQNARLAINGERYFRTMYDSSNESWNQRDHSMFETLRSVMAFRGKTSKAIVWAHNSHIGDARATERSEYNEFNLGQLVRETFADNAYLIGFATDHGTVAAASQWGGPMQVMQIPPSNRDSYGYLFHQVKTDNFLLPLRDHWIT